MSKSMFVNLSMDIRISRSYSDINVEKMGVKEMK